jgi:2-keto-3-deoxy-L-rhamnonate aldolase RhmA
VVTGRLTRSARDSSTLLGTWQALVDDPRVERLVASGFDYVYVDRTWWDDMDEAARQSLQAACVQEVATVHDNGRNGDRWLYDLRGCRPE